MNARSYKTIFVLLSACILFILVVQAYWLRNFYLQKTEEFERVVYASIEKLKTKLEERRNLQTLKTTYIIVDGKTIAKTPSRKMKVHSESNVRIVNRNEKSMQTEYKVSVSNEDKIGDSITIDGSEKTVDIRLNGAKGKKPKIILYKNNQPNQIVEDGFIKEINHVAKSDVQEINGVAKLIDKMITEINVMDTETEDADTLNVLIKRSLNNQGLFLPFEFSIQKHKDSIQLLKVQSDNFSEKLPSYTSDLSEDKIIGSHDRLFLQFPNKQDFVVAGMKKSVVLSLLFSLLVIGTFYYVIRLILKQKKLSEIKNDFINNMTHELKTPIATISLALDAINNPMVKNNHEKFTDYSRILKEENQKLNKHVERVLQMALLDKGELALHFTEVDTIHLINDVVSAYTLQIQEQKAKVEIITSLGSLKMKGDEEHLKVVFSNLLDNALKYSKNSCEISIQLKQINNEIEIIFKDNGIGIDAKNQARIFDKFYREQGGNLHDVKGFGIGLSYARSIVEKHDGTIRLQSEKGKGSSFIILFKI